VTCRTGSGCRSEHPENGRTQNDSAGHLADDGRLFQAAHDLAAQKSDAQHRRELQGQLDEIL
jgi:hypothetical protein